MLLALGVGLAALVIGGGAWLKNKVLVIDPGTGTPLGSSMRTGAHIATLIQTLEPYTPSLNRAHSKDRQRLGIPLVPLDGSASRLVPGAGDADGALGDARRRDEGKAPPHERGDATGPRGASFASSSSVKETPKSRPKSVFAPETQGNVQPMRLRNGSMCPMGALETVTNEMSRCARWTTMPL